MLRPLFRPTDCAAVGGPTISRVQGCINDEMKECLVCGDAVVHDMTEHSFFGFACSCPYGRPKEEEREQWLPEGRWAAGRWRPDPPTVPKWLIARVEAALQQGVGQ